MISPVASVDPSSMTSTRPRDEHAPSSDLAVASITRSSFRAGTTNTNTSGSRPPVCTVRLRRDSSTVPIR
jgi:hypothetical protein